MTDIIILGWHVTQTDDGGFKAEKPGETVTLWAPNAATLMELIAAREDQKK